MKAFDLEQAVNRFGLLTRVTETLALLCSVGLTLPPKRAAKKTLSALALAVFSQLNHVAPQHPPTSHRLWWAGRNATVGPDGNPLRVDR